MGQLHGAEKEMLVEEIKPQFFTLKKNGSSRQLQALEKLLGLGTGQRSDGQTDGISLTPTPALTNETSSPQTSSPPSTHVSAVGLTSEDGPKKYSAAVQGVKVHEEEA